MWPKYDRTWISPAAGSTFKPPPLSGMTYPEVLDYNYDHSPDHIHFVYAAPGSNDIVRVPWRRTTRAAWRVAHSVYAAARSAPVPRFAVLAASDTITTTMVINGILRAGFETLLISTRMSAAVIAGMLQAQGTTHVFVSPDAAMTALAASIVDIVGMDALQVLVMPMLEALFEAGDVERPPVVAPGPEDVSVIMHSSGSTAAPKRVPFPHRSLVRMGIQGWHSDFDMSGMTAGWFVMPMFHILGAYSMSLAAFVGTTIAVYPPVGPPIVPSPASVLAHIQHTRAQSVLIPPVILHELVATRLADTLAVLAPLKVVAYGGGTLNRAIGDALARGGVRLGSIYGLTEVLAVTDVLCGADAEDDWEWVHVPPQVRIHFRDLGDGTCEPVYLNSSYHMNNVNNCVFEDEPAYESRDVVELHPTKPNTFRVIGRVDDQIVFSTGEKINPTPYENILQSDDVVAFAIMFGSNSPHAGVVIQPREFAAPVSPAAFLERLKPSLDQLNTVVPAFARILPEMVIIATPDRPFELGPKGMPRRSQVLKSYQAEIKAAYESFGRSAFPILQDWAPDRVLDFIRSVLRMGIGRDLPDDSDFFQHGCDSLRAAWIRGAIVNSLPADRRQHVPHAVVYEHPTIAKLAAAVSSVVSDDTAVSLPLQDRINRLHALVEQYTQDLPHRAPNSTVRVHNDQVVLLTGSTGGFGSHILATLLADESVRLVYAVNRDRSSPARERQEQSFTERGLDVLLLNTSVTSGRLVFVGADTSKAQFGLEDDLYNELSSSVTLIIHNAWPVNFVYSLQTFEPAIASVTNMIDLALRSTLSVQPKIVFVSSVSVCRNLTSTSANATPEEFLDDPSGLVGSGYAESKWVGERILQAAAQRAALRVAIVRVAQLCGGDNGFWTPRDWVPAIARSARAVGCLPELPEVNVGWVRPQDAAAALLELAAADGVLHVVHPAPVPWTRIFGAMGRALAVPLVPFADWLARLETMPAEQLLPFFREIGSAPHFAGMENVASTKACRLSAAMKGMRPLDEQDVQLWIAAWRKMGMLD